jgi:NAD(P)H dehydrogenase (quinone)
MRVLVVFAHPSHESFNAALHARVLAALSGRGHEVDDCDLYAESFDPLLSEDDLAVYQDIGPNRRRVAPYVDRLLRANALVLIYPVWNEGFPAILKGFLDRVFLPGVAFEKSAEGSIKPALQNIGKLSAVCTYGAGRLATVLAGDPPRRVVKRMMRGMTGRRIRCDYLALHGMNYATPKRRAAFAEEVSRSFERW